MQLTGVIQPGDTIDAMVQYLDFEQTFLDLAGGSEFTEGIQGRYFKGLVDGRMDPENFMDVRIIISMISPLFTLSINTMELGPKDIN